MPHDLASLAADELVDHLGQVLRVAGLFDIEPEANQDEEEHQPGEDDQLQGERIVDRMAGVSGVNAELLQQRIERSAEPVVQQTSNEVDPGKHASSLLAKEANGLDGKGNDG